MRSWQKPRFLPAADGEMSDQIASGNLIQIVKASSSIGRAAVSKTAGWGFDSLLACHLSGALARPTFNGVAMRNPDKLSGANARQEDTT
jgi:hypothetical protein